MTPNGYEYAILFVLTYLLELPVYYFGIRFLERFAPSQEKGVPYPPLKIFKIVLWLNLATHPMVNFVFPFLARLQICSEANALAISEVFAIVVETIIFRSLGFSGMAMSLMFALIANAVSWTLGQWIIRQLFL